MSLPPQKSWFAQVINWEVHEKWPMTFQIVQEAFLIPDFEIAQ